MNLESSMIKLPFPLDTYTIPKSELEAVTTLFSNEVLLMTIVTSPLAWITSPPSWPLIKESLMLTLPLVVIKSPAPGLLIIVTLSNRVSFA